MATILPADETVLGPPLHGFRGDTPDAPIRQPRGLTVALSREAGARGTSIAHKLGELLGWQVFDQEMLDHLLVNDSGRAQLFSELSDGARAWVDSRFEQLQRENRIKADVETREGMRLLLAVAARGDAVIVGRGAGFLLPVETTLHVRIVSPFESRTNYLAQSLRLTRDEAAAEVRTRDERRAQYLKRTLLREPTDMTGYDLVVNSGRIGVEAATQFIGWAVRTKQQFGGLAGPPGAAGIEEFMGA
jgi:cytidylate kinase